MLLRILKLFGIDVAAKVAEIREELESRAALATARLTRALREASIFACLGILAALSAAGAVCVALIAIYSWVALEYGQFYGYAAVGGVLVSLSAVFAVTGLTLANSWSLDSSSVVEQLPSPSAQEASDEFSIEHQTGTDAENIQPKDLMPNYSRATPSSEGTSPILPARTFPELIPLPVTGNPIIDGLIDGLRIPAGDAVGDILDVAADTIRRGEREKLLMTLGIAMFAGFFVARMRSRGQSH